MKWNKRLQCIKFHLYELLEEAKLYLMNNGKGLVGGDKLVAKRCGGKFQSGANLQYLECGCVGMAKYVCQNSLTVHFKKVTFTEVKLYLSSSDFEKVIENKTDFRHT